MPNIPESHQPVELVNAIGLSCRRPRLPQNKPLLQRVGF